MTLEQIKEVAKRKLGIASRQKQLTEQEKEKYLEIFFDDTISNIAYSQATIKNYLKEI